MSGLGQLPFVLPNRRISRCEKASYRGAHSFYVRCGFHPDGSVREVFFAAKRETTDLVEFASDAAILISKQLQAGARLADLALQARDGLLGTVIVTALQMERECAAEVRAEYAAAGVAA